jgi:hypothetical protein
MYVNMEGANCETETGRSGKWNEGFTVSCAIFRSRMKRNFKLKIVSQTSVDVKLSEIHNDKHKKANYIF